MLCNPIDRAYSDFNHKLRKSTKFQKFIREENIENFDDFVMRYSPKLRMMKDKKLTKLLDEGIYEDGKHWFSTLTGKLNLKLCILDPHYGFEVLQLSKTLCYILTSNVAYARVDSPGDSFYI